MKKENSNNIIISLLIIIIVILVTTIVLLVTGTVNINNNSVKDSQQSNQNIDNSNENQNAESNQDNQTLESNQTIYSAVLNEYKNALLDNDINTINFKYVNENAINKYFNQKGTEFEYNFTYAFYDINKDGKDEMLLNGIIDIFSYDGDNIIRLFNNKANCLAEGRCSISLFDNGTIYFRGSNGASSSTVSFYSINKNISTLNTINSYYLKYGEEGSLAIYDEITYDFINDTGTKLDYNSDKELINENIKNANEIDLNKLKWTTIK